MNEDTRVSDNIWRLVFLCLQRGYIAGVLIIIIILIVCINTVSPCIFPYLEETIIPSFKHV